MKCEAVERKKLGGGRVVYVWRSRCCDGEDELGTGGYQVKVSSGTRGSFGIRRLQ